MISMEDHYRASSSACRYHPRTIIHIDLDCFYAQVEMVRNPTLRSKPLGIQQKYLLVTCNYVARSRGVTKLMRVTEALQRCPDLVIVSGEDLTHYREISYRITELLRQFSPLVERLGFDENFIDVSNLVGKRSHENISEVLGRVYGEESTDPAQVVCSCGCHPRLIIGSHIANEMRETLQSQLGLTSCAGIAHNKLLAKLVGSVHKPNNQTTLFPHMVPRLMESLQKVTKVPGIGHSTGKKLAGLGITTLSDVLDAPFTMLKNEFGYQTAATMQKLCQGYDESPVIQSGPPQSMSDEDSFKKCGTLQDARHKMEALLTSLLQRLKQDGRQPQTLRLSVRKYSEIHKWNRESRQCAMPDGILHSLRMDEGATRSRLLDVCVRLFHKMVDTSKTFHLTLINVCFAKFYSTSTATTDIGKFFSPRPANKESEGDAVKMNKPAITHIRERESINGLKASSSPVSDLDTNRETPVTSSKSLSVPRYRDTEVKLQLEEVPEDNLPTPSHKVDVVVCPCLHSSAAPLSSKDWRCLCKVPHDCTDIDVNSINSQTNNGGIVDIEKSQSFELSRQIEAGVRNHSVSPSTRYSFFATKSNNSDKTCSFVTLACPGAFNEADDNTCSSEIHESACCKREVHVQRGLNTDNVPPNVDPSVFAELPKDMQQELQREWNNATLAPAPQTVGEPSKHKMGLQYIDQSVLEELPADIQEEVLQQQKQRKRPLSSLSPQTRKTSPVKRSKSFHTNRDRTACRSRIITSFFGPKMKSNKF